MGITYAPQTTDPKAPEWARQQSHLAAALVTLKRQLDEQHPTRDRTSDGFIGDARHLKAGAASDHNPWWENTVRAADFDKDGINAPWLAEQLRLAGRSGDPRLIRGGYVIWNGHITLPDFSGWTPYVGDPHTGHVHVSLAPHGACELADPWPFLVVAAPQGQPSDPGPIRPAPPAAAPPAAAPPAPVWTGPDARSAGAGFRAEVGNNGERVQHMQAELNRIFPAYSQLATDGWYGPKTGAVIAEFCHRAAQDPNTPVGDRNGLEESDGQNVGPRAARAFLRYGVQV